MEGKVYSYVITMCHSKRYGKLNKYKSLTVNKNTVWRNFFLSRSSVLQYVKAVYVRNQLNCSTQSFNRQLDKGCNQLHVSSFELF